MTPILDQHRTARQGRLLVLLQTALLAVTALASLMWFRAVAGGATSAFDVVVGAPFVWAACWLLAKPRREGSCLLTGGIATVLLLAVVSGWAVIEDIGRDEPMRGGLTLVHTLWMLTVVVVPVVRLALRPLRARAGRLDRIAGNRQRELDYADRLERQQHRLTHPSSPGRMTGFEPAALARLQYTRPEHMYGVPGAGLSGSGFDAGAIAKGQLGEVNFAKVLDQQGLLSRFATFWSVHMPDEVVGASRQYQSDIDCVIVTGTTIWLLDMKNYRQGDVTWRADGAKLLCVDNPTGYDVGEPHAMSRNMALAHDRVAAKFAGLATRHRVVSRVVFMPTDQGVGIVDGLTWPGGIRAENLPDTLAALHRERPFDPRSDDGSLAVRVFQWLVKDSSGSAPRPGDGRRSSGDR